MHAKQQIRKTLLKKRHQLTPIQQKKAAIVITKKLSQKLFFKKSQHIAFYLSVKNEVSPKSLMQQAWRMKKKCYLPVLHPLKHNRLWFIEYRPGDKLEKNCYGILQPKINLAKKIPAWALNLVIVPLVGFDQNGNRLGSGKGYYDRTFYFLKNKKSSQPYLVGIAYELQKISDLAVEPWDIPLRMVITEL